MKDRSNTYLLHGEFSLLLKWISAESLRSRLLSFWKHPLEGQGIYTYSYAKTDYVYIYVYIHSSIRTDGIRGHSSPQHAVPATSNYVLPVATFSNVIKSILSFESLFIPGFSFSLLRCGGSEDEAWTDRVPCPETPKTPKFLTHFRPSCVLHILQICRIC